MTESFSPEDALNMDHPADWFMCSRSANTFGVKFLDFRLRDVDSGEILIEVSREEWEILDWMQEEEAKRWGVDNSMDDEERVVEYNFGPTFLELKSIGMQVGISIGEKPVKSIWMIEKHFFKGNCVKTYDFKTGFCIPHTINTWETIYLLPELDEETKMDMIESTGESSSDSYFFIEEKLFMH